MTTKQSPIHDTQPHKQVQQLAKTPAGIEALGGQMAMLELGSGLLSAAENPVGPLQAAWLGDPRLAGAQQRAAAAQIGRMQGNQHLQMVIASLRREETAQPSKSNGHGQHAAVNRNTTKPTNGATDGAEVERDGLAELFGLVGPGGSLSIVGAEPPPSGQGNGKVTALHGVQRQPDAGIEAEETPTGEEKAAALAKAKAAQAQATQTVGETKTKIAESRNEADTEKTAGQAKKEETAAAKAAQPEPVAAASGDVAPLPAEVAPATEEAPVEALAPEAAPGAYEKAPASPQQDPGFQAVTTRIRGAASQQRSHAPAAAKSAAAQAAAEPRAGEVTSKAQARQVAEMERAETPGFDAAAFKARLMQRVQELAPKTADEADSFKKENKLGGLKGEAKGDVAAQKNASLEPTKTTAAQAPDTAGIEPKPVTPLQPAEPGAPPPAVGAQQAAIKPKGSAEVEAPMQEESKSLDTQMAEANVTDKQLATSNEPEFQAALGAKKEAQANAQQAPREYRTAEQAQIAQAEAEAVGAAQERTQAMHGDRAALLGQVAGKQSATKAKDEEERARVASDIQKIYDKTKANVERILSELDARVERTFDAGAEAAKKGFEDYVDAKMTAFKEERYGGWFGWARWAKDKLFGMPDEVNAFYAEGRQLFLQKMDAVIDDVAMIVGKGLAEAKAEIANGKKEVQTYVNQLPANLRRVGQQAASDIQDKFAALEDQVNSKQDELIDSLAQRYQEKLQAVDARIEEMKAANRGLVAKAFDFIKNVVGTIVKLVQMLTRIMAKIAEVVGLIIQDPINFLGNFIDGIKLGFNNFVANIGTHLQKGLIAWLTGAMEGVTIQMPEDVFSLPGIFSLVMQILGLTWDYIRAKAVKLMGEKVVKVLETAFTPFKILVTEGPGGLWQWVKDQFNDLKDTVMEAIKDMVITEVIKAGIKWLLGLFNPIGAFIKACMAIYEIVMFFVNNAERIGALIESIVDAAGAIARGTVSAGAKLIEDSLAKLVPIVIGFLASLLGLGDLGKKVLGIFQKVRGRIDKMIDKILVKAKSIAKKLMAKMRGGEKERLAASGAKFTDRDHEVGLRALEVEEKAYASGGLTREEAQETAIRVASKHPVFKSIRVIEAEEHWNYEYVFRSLKASSVSKASMKTIEVTVEPFVCRVTKRGHSRTEFRRQLDLQERAINRLTAAEWRANRHRFLESRQDKTAMEEFEREKTNARNQARRLIKKRLIQKRIKEINELNEKRLARNEITRLPSQAQVGKQAVLWAEKQLENKAILHEIDTIAGGTPEGIQLRVSALGSFGVNSSIGAQWQTRVEAIQEAVDNAIKQKRHDAKMQVKLPMRSE